MKALTLWQPWASLIALGHKRIETRSWSTDYRGDLVIHASSRTTGWGFKGTLSEISSGGYHSGFTVQKDASGLLLRGPIAWPYRLPLGAAVAIVRLVDCAPMTAANIAALPDAERALGDYAPGRYHWLLEDVRPLREPVPMIGFQRLYDLTMQETAAIRREVAR